VWLHDPTDPAGTVAQYLFGGTGRSGEPAAASTELQFVGREFPVFQYGEQQTNEVRTTVQVPHGPDWATQVQALRDIPALKRTLCYRDNRGRIVFGRIGVRDTDQDYGSLVDLMVDRSDFDEAV
jgi:hypothetical protein